MMRGRGPSPSSARCSTRAAGVEACNGLKPGKPFELGARPHPPRELYRAYLRQSNVFVGLYAERYGWVAPGESVGAMDMVYRGPEVGDAALRRRPVSERMAH